MYSLYDSGHWEEFDVFSLMDEQGRAPEREQVEEAMERHFETLREETY